MQEQITIRQVDVAEIYQIRLRNLRPGQPIDSVYFDGDKADSTIHFGVFVGDLLVGCDTLMQVNSPLFDYTKQYQMRGMAIDAPYRGSKLGKGLLKYAEWIALRRGIDFIWLNARCDVIDFYVKSGYCTFGEKFMIPNVCEHVVMYKQITPHVCSCEQ